MSHEKTRANDFDRRCGLIQTQKAIELGVGKSLLDIGCGVGEYTYLFLDRFPTVVGLDPDPELLEQAKRDHPEVEYVVGWGESFELGRKFDTISMNNLLEHVDNPVALLKNCKKHLADGGVILAQVPNSESVTRRLGVLMGVIPNLGHISEKEKSFYGHQRVYTLPGLLLDVVAAGLEVVSSGGLVYKPIPNDALEMLCREYGEEWATKFLDALIKFGEGRPDECGYLYFVAR